jgi:hypothetical protein
MNNKDNKSSKKVLIIIIAIVVVAIGYYLYSSGDSEVAVDQDSSLVTQSADFGETQIVGARVLSLLNQISSLNIDDSIFQSAAYKSLVDYTISIPEQNVGRQNPFAPLPGYVPSTPSRSTTRGR